MRPFLARFSEPVWSGHLASWADFITTTPELEFSGRHNGADCTRMVGNSVGVGRVVDEMKDQVS